MNYREQRNYENIQKAVYSGAGVYDIPIIRPTEYEECEWISFNEAIKSNKREEKGVHFFLNDYRFIRIWTNIDKYIPMLRQFKCIMTPNFSLYTDFPVALQIYNHYRKHWIGAYLQDYGINVIPTICWSTPESFEWCFDGEPVGGCVAVSSIGTQNSKEKKALFRAGYDEMMERLRPNKIIFYGSVPDDCKGDIIRIKPFSDKFNVAEVAAW